jgi:hypothetical protein
MISDIYAEGNAETAVPYIVKGHDGEGFPRPFFATDNWICGSDGSDLFAIGSFVAPFRTMVNLM